MAVSAERLYQASQLHPSMLGEDIIDRDADEEAQREAAIAWIESTILDGADAEVSIPLDTISGYDTLEELVAAALPTATSEARARRVLKGEKLYDLAVLSYARSEINKSIASNAPSYDKDADQDRIQGNDRLKKLLAWAEMLGARAEEAGAGGVADTSAPRSISRRVRSVFP